MTNHNDRQHQVMTNEPRFADQLAMTRYWSRIDPTTFLPGPGRAEDRFLRASFLINAIPKTDNRREAAAAVFSVMRNVLASYGISINDQPNLSMIRWRVVADQTDGIYHFDSVMSPNVFRVDLTQLDLAEGSGVRMLDLGLDQVNSMSGEVSALFVPTDPFVFEPAAEGRLGAGRCKSRLGPHGSKPRVDREARQDRHDPGAHRCLHL